MLAKVDIAIIGAGVVGLALAYELSRHGNRTIVVLEKNSSFGMETSSRNSQVIHAGIFYPASLLKTSLCIDGRPRLYEFCRRYKVGHKRLGKLVVAPGSREIIGLEELRQQATANGVELQPLSSREIHALEPSISVHAALFSPESGIVDVHQLMQNLYYLGREKGVIFAFHSELLGLEYSSQGYTLTTNRDRFQAEWVINSAGLAGDAVPKLLGFNIDEYGYRIFPCKGEYYTLNKSFGIKHLIYPLPEASGLLGIHITPDLSGRLRLGPNAYDVDTISYDISNKYHDIFYQSVHNFLPAMQHEDIAPDFTGIRPRRKKCSAPLQDFLISEEKAKGFPGLINLIGIESPGLTCSLAIANHVSSLIS